MLNSIAAAGKRLHPVHVLAAALLLCCLSLLLHSQLQVHSQLAAANRELTDIKNALASAAYGPTDTPGALWHWNSSSSSSMSGHQHSSVLLHQIVQLTRKQQKLLNSLPRGRNKPLLHRVQQLSDEADSVLAPVLSALGSSGNGTAAMQHKRPMHATSASTTGIPGNGIFSDLQTQQGTQMGSNSTAAVPPGTLCIDLVEFLGLHQFLAGITWEPKACYTGLGQIYTDKGDQEGLRQRLLQDLTTTIATVRGVSPDRINISAPWWASVVGQTPTPPKAMLSDPGFHKWQASLVGVLARYLVLVDTKTPAVPCKDAPPAWEAAAVAAKELPLEKCEGRSDEELLKQMGRHGQPFDPLVNIVNVVISHGVCTVPDRAGFNSYGDFLMARAMTSNWRTFKTRSLEEDAVVFLWDILYQAREVFMKQRWLGVAAMQQPFDFLAISDIIYEVQPDVILETGTANGGSALMWASILELNGLTNSSVITVDIQKPGGAGAFGADQPAAVMTANGQVVMVPRKRPQQNPLKHPLWDKYVTFVEGSSIESATITRVKALLQEKQHALWQRDAADDADGSAADDTAEATNTTTTRRSSGIERQIQATQQPLRVLVLLDSHHAAAHVLTEMESYCPLVSAGSFCIVEDTKLSRWTNSDPGPLSSVQSFLAWHPEFAVDRDRELLFTHHPYGYLQRLY